MKIKMKNLLRKSILLITMIFCQNLFSGENPNPDNLFKELQSDDFWKNHPSKAVENLREFLKIDLDRGIPILIKRFDGWSNQNAKVIASGAGPSWSGKENYTLMPLVSELDADGILRLLHSLATTSKFGGEQSVKMSTALESTTGSRQELLAQIRKAIAIYKLSPAEVKQLKNNLNLNVDI